MAIPTHTVNIGVVDSEGSESIVTAYFTGTDVAADSFATDLFAMVGVLSQGTVQSASVTKTLALTPIAGVVGTDNEIKGKFTFRNLDGRLRSVSIPSFDRAAFMLALSDQINTTNQSVIDFIELMVDTAGVVDLNAIDLVALKSATEHYGNRN